ncbi:MAG: putative toxin-antitoxin system toxin component, PIN family [Gammaproteobacteria bacterium]
MSPLVVVDTNVVVAGLLTAHAESPVARVLDGMLEALFPFALSEALLAEYRTVLRRPSLRKAHGLTPDELDVILVELAQHAIVLPPVPAPPAPDRGDQHLWELLAARQGLLLITGDKRLQQDDVMGHRVLSPATFVERWLPLSL